MRITSVFRELLSCRELVVQDIGFVDDGLVIDVAPRWRRPRCGKCGRKRVAYDRSPARRWRHLALGQTIFWLQYAPRRVDCGACGVTSEAVPWARHQSRFTRDLEEMTAYLAQRMDRTAVRKLLGINWRTVGSIVERIVGERLDPYRLEELYVIGIDEISFRRNHEYVTTVVDHLKRRVAWTGEGKSGDTLRGFFDEIGEEKAKQITHVTIDLSAAYIEVVKERAPQAKIAFDRFHVQRLASNAVDEVRREQVRELKGTEEGRALKNTRWALLKNPWDLTSREGEKLAALQRTNQPLYRSYLLKETLADILDGKQPGVAARRLEEWQNWSAHSKLPPFVKLAKTIRKHAEGIIEYVRTRLTNGITEGLNNKTRLITRRAFGFHSAQALSAMIHLCCGGITLDPPIPLPTSNA